MCCIIHRLKDSDPIKEDNLKAIIKVNPDGWGISYVKDGVLKVRKSLEMDLALQQIRELEKENIEFLFHARYATHGKVIELNCHPYDLDDGVMFHNGKIDIKCRNKKFSDTYYFAKLVNKLLGQRKSLEWIMSNFKSKIDNSRFAFMHKDGTITKFGEWHDVDGNLFSKINWKWEARKYGYSSYGVYDWTDWDESPGQPVTSNYDDAFEKIVKNCEDNLDLYNFLLKKLSDEELIKIAIHYPKLCAKHLLLDRRVQI